MAIKKKRGGNQKLKERPHLTTFSTKKGRVSSIGEPHLQRIWECAFKPYEKRWEDIAREWGVNTRTVHEYRENHRKEIEALQREKLLGGREAVLQALFDRAKGVKLKRVRKAVRADGTQRDVEVSIAEEPPDARAAQYFLQRCDMVSTIGDIDGFDLFADYYPLLKQTLPLLHWDRAYSNSGHDQILGVMAGRGFGKSLTIARKGINLARINRGCEGMIMAPTYKMLANPIKQYWEDSLRACRIPFTLHKQDGLYTLWGDTKVWFRSYDNVDTSGRGPTLAWLICDEFREGSQDVSNVVLATVRDPKAKLRQSAFFSTPNGFDHMYEMFGNPESKLLKSGRAILYGGTAHDNVYLPSTVIDMLTEAYDEQIIKQELYGQFVNVAQGNIYYNFDRALHIGDYPFDPKLPVWIGQDFNFNPLCSVILQPHNFNGKVEVWAVDEIRIEGASTDELCNELKQRGYDPETIPSDNLIVFPDASGSQKGAAQGSLSNIEVMRNRGYLNIKHPRANCLVRDRYASVNGLLRNSLGDIRLRINKSCRYLINDMEREVYRTGSNLRDDSSSESKKRGHLADGLGYAIHWNFRIETAFSAAYSYA